MTSSVELNQLAKKIRGAFALKLILDKKVTFHGEMDRIKLLSANLLPSGVGRDVCFEEFESMEVVRSELGILGASCNSVIFPSRGPQDPRDAQ